MCSTITLAYRTMFECIHSVNRYSFFESTLRPRERIQSRVGKTELHESRSLGVKFCDFQI